MREQTLLERTVFSSKVASLGSPGHDLHVMTEEKLPFASILDRPRGCVETLHGFNSFSLGSLCCFGITTYHVDEEQVVDGEASWDIKPHTSSCRASTGGRNSLLEMCTFYFVSCIISYVERSTCSLKLVCLLSPFVAHL